MTEEERYQRLVELSKDIESHTRYDEPPPEEADQWMFVHTLFDLPSGGTRPVPSWVSKKHYWEWYRLRNPDFPHDDYRETL